MDIMVFNHSHTRTSQVNMIQFSYFCLDKIKTAFKKADNENYLWLQP